MRTIRSGLRASNVTAAALGDLNRFVIGEQPHAVLTGEDASARGQCMISAQLGMPDQLVGQRVPAFIGLELRRDRLRDLTVDQSPPRLGNSAIRSAADQIVGKIVTRFADAADDAVAFQFGKRVVPFPRRQLYTPGQNTNVEFTPQRRSPWQQRACRAFREVEADWRALAVGDSLRFRWSKTKPSSPACGRTNSRASSSVTPRRR